MSYEYNPEAIRQGIHARKVLCAKCRKIAIEAAPFELPEKCIKRICTRRKLYNFLEALDLSPASIKAIFQANDIPVPRDRSLKPGHVPKPEPRVKWLDQVNKEANDNDVFV